MFAVITSQDLYVLMRIHQVLTDRLGKAVTLAEDAKALKATQVSSSRPDRALNPETI